MKYALLELLQERPMHGYEMMRALQDRSGGMYKPSPGSVYPTLQMLEDQGYVTAREVEGKKVYSITEAGRAFLAEDRREPRRGPGRRGFWGMPEEEWADVATLWQELRTLAPIAGRALHQARHDPERLQQLRRLLELVRVELTKIAGDAEQFDA